MPQFPVTYKLTQQTVKITGNENKENDAYMRVYCVLDMQCFLVVRCGIYHTSHLNFLGTHVSIKLDQGEEPEGPNPPPPPPYFG